MKPNSKFVGFAPAFLLALFSVFAANFSAFAVTVNSETHPALVTHEFSSQIPFVAYKREGGVASGTRFNIEKGALKITNAFGGSFGVDTKIAAFDAAKFGDVFFDYLLPPTQNANQKVRVNFFFRVKGIYHGVNFTGPPEVRPGSVLLGTIPKVTADGKWHRAHIPLRDWLRKIYPRDDQIKVDEIIIGNWNSANFLMSGIGGNGAGATWKMDNFVIAGVGPKDAKFSLEQEPGKPLEKPTEYSWSLDGAAATPLKTAEISLSASDGFHLMQVLDKAKKPVADYGFYVAQNAPQSGKAELVNGVVQIPIESGAGLNLKTLKLTVGERSFESDSPYLSWNGARGVLRLDAARAGLVWKNSQQIPVLLSGAQDTLGRALPDLKSTLAVDFARQKDAPPLPQLEALSGAGSGTFEESMDEWSSKADAEGAAIVERDASTKASGDYSLRLTSPTNSATLGSWIRRTPFDVTKFPAIEFDYRLTTDVRADFLLSIGGKIYSVGFTDRTPQHARIGQIAGIEADEKWHHARLDLLPMLQNAKPPITTQTVDWLAISDSGYLGNARGDQFWIDNFQMVSLVKGAPFSSKVILSDVTGVKALSWVLDDKPNTIPPATAKTNGDVLSLTGTGAQWLHLRAQNGAGQWSQASHWPLILDAGPPVIAKVSPAPGAKSAATRFAVDLDEDTAINLASINLTMLEKKYSLREKQVLNSTLSLKQNQLVFDFDRALRFGEIQPLADGARVAWSLKSVRDIAGQSTPALEGEWIYDFAADKTGPRAWTRSNSHEATTEDFNDGLPPTSYDQTQNFRPGATVWRPDNARLEIAQRDENKDGEGRENLALRVVTTEKNCSLLRWQTTDFNYTPIIGFYYKFPPQLNLAISLQNQKTWYLGLVGNTPGAVAQIPNIVADNQWHWAQINMKALGEKMENLSAANVTFADASGETPVGTAWEIDDFSMQKVTPGEVDLYWYAQDLSGVSKYRFAWDQNPDTDPTEETTEISRKTPAATGLWWAHVQAQDKAGNWGKVAHSPIMQS